jgi:hypothetical protein
MTYAKPTGTGFSFSDPYSQKTKAIDDIRSAVRGQIKEWFSELMPGIFSSNSDENEFPTCEFLTFRKTEPFANVDQGKKPNEYLRILDTYGDWDTWTTEQYPGLKFTWPTTRARDERCAITAIKEESLTKIDLSSYGDPGADALIARIDLEMKTLMTRYGCVQLLDSFERRLNRTRDEKSFRSINQDSLTLLNNLRSIMSESVDIAAMTPELTFLAGQRAWFDHEIPEFKMSGRHPDGRVIFLKPALREIIAKKAKRLSSTDRALKDALIQQGNLVSASENIKLQRRIAILTIILTFLTIVMAYEPIAKLLALAHSTPPQSAITLPPSPPPASSSASP